MIKFARSMGWTFWIAFASRRRWNRNFFGGCVLLIFTGCNSAAESNESQCPQQPILIVTAVDYEFNAVTSLLASPQYESSGGRSIAKGCLGNISIIAIRSGWGKIHAAGATSAAIQKYNPLLVFMAGVGGGIDSRFAASGDVVLATETFQYDLGKLPMGRLRSGSQKLRSKRDIPSNFSPLKSFSPRLLKR